PFLQGALPISPSGKALRRLLEANFCRINGRIERFGSVLLQKGDVIELSSNWETFLDPKKKEEKKFSILFEDENLLIVDKPIGWVCSEENCRETFGPKLSLVHRLDKETTGVLVLAKNEKSRKECMALFAEKEVEKEYVALVDGVFLKDEEVVENYLIRKRTLHGQTIWGSGPKGLYAMTRFQRISSGQNATFVRCLPVTGRTHQIRVHLAEKGHPILIDRQYASRFQSKITAVRPLLHAKRIQLMGVEVEAPMPQDLEKAVKLL
ncbi:MAG: RluA family pseudouridine synthase, partial [Chlamydiae bacterium]|nr:RluA family pseudouridine synthase [Chlamydiota bacterium]